MISEEEKLKMQQVILQQQEIIGSLKFKVQGLMNIVNEINDIKKRQDTLNELYNKKRKVEDC